MDIEQPSGDRRQLLHEIANLSNILRCHGIPLPNLRVTAKVLAKGHTEVPIDDLRVTKRELAALLGQLQKRERAADGKINSLKLGMGLAVLLAAFGGAYLEKFLRAKGNAQASIAISKPQDIETPVKPTEPPLPKLTTPETPKPSLPKPFEQWGDWDRQTLEDVIREAAGITPASNRAIFLAKSFIGTPSKDRVFSQTDPEEFMVDFEGMNCLSFVESVLALANAHHYEEFLEMLQRIRYYNGEISYANRNHYMTADWVPHNERFAEDVTRQIGGDLVQTAFKRLPEMTPGRTRSGNFIETAIPYIPAAHVVEVESGIQDGDILLFTSRLHDLDVKHVGFAIWRSGRVHVLHAKSKQSVQISREPLTEYILLGGTRGSYHMFSGIQVIRLKGQ